MLNNSNSLFKKSRFKREAMPLSSLLRDVLPLYAFQFLISVMVALRNLV
jgi:hypothetical protein